MKSQNTHSKRKHENKEKLKNRTCAYAASICSHASDSEREKASKSENES